MLSQVKETRHERIHTVWLHLYKTLEKINLIYSDKNQGLAGAGSRGRLPEKGHKESFGSEEKILYLD